MDEHAVHVGEPAFDVGAGPHAVSLAGVADGRARAGGVAVETVPRAAWTLPDLTGRTYLVTGSNAGLGFFSTEYLVRAGAHVIMTARHPNRLAAARAALHRRNPDAARTRSRR